MLSLRLLLKLLGVDLLPLLLFLHEAVKQRLHLIVAHDFISLLDISICKHYLVLLLSSFLLLLINHIDITIVPLALLHVLSQLSHLYRQFSVVSLLRLPLLPDESVEFVLFRLIVWAPGVRPPGTLLPSQQLSLSFELDFVAEGLLVLEGAAEEGLRLFFRVEIYPLWVVFIFVLKAFTATAPRTQGLGFYLSSKGALDLAIVLHLHKQVARIADLNINRG